MILKMFAFNEKQQIWILKTDSEFYCASSKTDTGKSNSH